MPSELMKQASIHLEFLGYTLSPVEGEKEVLRVTHPGRGAFLLSASDHVFRFASYFATKKVELPGFLKFINSLNLKSAVVSFCKNDFNTLVCQAAFYGVYNKTNFAFFLDAWDYDMGKAMDERIEEFRKYLE